MKKAFIITKTNWDEPPRLRHDVAFLLKDIGFSVSFFERPHFLFNTGCRKSDEGILLCSQAELLHHQLRINTALTFINKLFTSYVNFKSHTKPDVIFNFNYDYYWLNQFFPGTPIITIINDDFVDMAKFLSKKEAQRVHQLTVKNSNITYFTHTSLLNRWGKYGDNTKIFLPWVDQYNVPIIPKTGNRLLFWGYLSDRLDWETLECLVDNGIQLDLIGPSINKDVTSKIEHLKKKGARYLGKKTFDELRKIAPSYFASIIPYNLEKPGNRSISVSNRFFKLLSLGLPVVVSNLPFMINAPHEIVYIYNSPKNCIDIVNLLTKRDRCSSVFEQFLENHNKYERKKELICDLKAGVSKSGFGCWPVFG